jgi:putative transposase
VISCFLNGTPPKTIEWLTDNGSCYTSAETRIFAKENGLKPVTTPIKAIKVTAWLRAL